MVCVELLHRRPRHAVYAGKRRHAILYMKTTACCLYRNDGMLSRVGGNDAMLSTQETTPCCPASGETTARGREAGFPTPGVAPCP